jgi:hypothetical protein
MSWARFSFLVAPRTQKVEQFVYDQEQTLVGVFLVEGGHHGHQQVLAVGSFAHRRELIGDTHLLRQCQLQLAKQDVAQGHGGRADLGAHHLELPGNRG